MAAALGFVATLLIALTIFIVTRPRVPQLTEADFEAATARWEKNGPRSYDLDLELTGNRPGRIHVEVRDGQVRHMTRDGVEPSQKRTWDYWSVPGQFDTIGQELEMARDPEKSFNVAPGTHMVMWAEFDPAFGYPGHYHRVVLGTPFEIEWTITRFQALNENN